PMAMLRRLPVAEERCLLTNEEGALRAVFLYQAKGKLFSRSYAKVLFVTKQSIKIRDENRQVWRITAQNEFEKGLIDRLCRHDQLLVYQVDDHIVAFEEIAREENDLATQLMQEALARFYIGNLT